MKHGEQTICELRSQLVSQISTLRRKLALLDELLAGTPRVTRKKRHILSKRGKVPHGATREAVMTALATTRFPVTVRVLRRRARVSATNTSKILRALVREGFLKVLRRGLYDKGERFA